jgi:catechol 2,3-dioxygenase-like lactoylglutathione lyase family enzyme
MGRFVRYEGGHIGISGDRALAVEWYCRHLGLTVAWDGAVEGQTLLRFPAPSAIPLVSVQGGTGGNLWGPAGDERRVTNVRLCLACPSLEGMHRLLVSEGVRVEPIIAGPNGVACFDFYDLEGTRLTATATDDSGGSAAMTRFSGYAAPRYGVRDLTAAIDWYAAHLGTRLLARQDADGTALLELGDFLPIWLETLPPHADVSRKPDFARPYFLSLDIDEAHAWASEHGLDPSPITGSPTALRVFHFWDPDGNQLNVWRYPEAVMRDA